MVRKKDLNKQKFNLKNFFLSKINRKITLLFIIVGILAPFLAIFYFYSISISSIPGATSPEIVMLLQTVAYMIIILIALNTGFIGFLLSRSISKPIKELYNATKQIEKGNYDIKLDIKTRDELQRLGEAFNKAASSLAQTKQERQEIDSAKTEFLSITSHELRSPITPMKAQLQMLEQGYLGKLSKKQKESIAIIIRNTDRLDNIIMDFLEISRIEAARLRFNFREIDLSDTVFETTQFMEGFAKEKNIKLVLNLDDLPIIEADPDRLSQILRNLINNAIKFSKQGSKIEINVRKRQNDILFSVKDNGEGITPEDQIRIFEPFYQVEKHSERRYGGTGLGLAICRGIVESQNGKIWVESKPGRGSKFSFTLPLQPVLDIKPIKVLFSQKSLIEKKIKEEFKSMLGPLGENEFEDLKNKNSLGKQDLFSYIDSLTQQYIITSDRGNIFKNKINNIYCEEKQTNNNLNSFKDTLEESKRD